MKTDCAEAVTSSLRAGGSPDGDLGAYHVQVNLF